MNPVRISAIKSGHGSVVAAQPKPWGDVKAIEGAKATPGRLAALEAAEALVKALK